MSTFLKIAIKTLAQEARFLRLAERHQLSNGRKLLGKYFKNFNGDIQYNQKHPKGADKPTPIEFKVPEKVAEYVDEAYEKYWNLTHQRKNIVRKEARMSLLAYGFLRDKAYSVLEAAGTYTPLNDDMFDRILDMAEQYTDLTDNELKAKFDTWRQEAEKALKIGVLRDRPAVAA